MRHQMHERPLCVALHDMNVHFVWRYMTRLAAYVVFIFNVV